MAYADITCNAGWLCYRMEQLSAKATGFDAGEYDRAFNVSNRDLGTSAKFIRKLYDLKVHKFQVISK